MDPQTEDPTTATHEGLDGPQDGQEAALEALPDLDVPEVRPAGGSTLLDTLRQKREDIAQRAVDGKNVLDVDVPGYDGRLFVRYAWPEGGWSRIQKMQAAAEGSKDPLAVLYVHAGIVNACTQQVLGRDEDGGEENPDPDDEVLGFDRRLAALLRIEIPDEVRQVARYVVRQVFSPEQRRTGEYAGDIAVSAHAIRVAQWLETRQGQVNEEFVGES
jgi:hypothetical protein